MEKKNSQGVLKINQFTEVRPGIVVKDKNGNVNCTPIFSRIISLYAQQNRLQFAVPGGLIRVGTTMDPTPTRSDRLVGQVLGEVGLCLMFSLRLMYIIKKLSLEEININYDLFFLID